MTPFLPHQAELIMLGLSRLIDDYDRHLTALEASKAKRKASGPQPPDPLDQAIRETKFQRRLIAEVRHRVECGDLTYELRRDIERMEEEIAETKRQATISTTVAVVFGIVFVAYCILKAMS